MKVTKIGTNVFLSQLVDWIDCIRRSCSLNESAEIAGPLWIKFYFISHMRCW